MWAGQLYKLIQFVKDTREEPLPIWLRDLQGLLDDYAVARCFTEGMVIERLCQNRFCDIIGITDMAESKFHDYCIAVDAEMIWMENSIVKPSHNDYKL